MTAVSRRQLWMQEMGPDSVAIIPTATPKIRSNDVEFPYRPDSNFYYLTGFDEPESILVLAPGREQGEHLLFLRPKSKQHEVWTGRRLGLDAAQTKLAMDQTLPIADFADLLPQLLAGRRSVYYHAGQEPQRDELIFRVLDRLRHGKGKKRAPLQVIEPDAWLFAQRANKQPEEIEAMDRAAGITIAAHKAAMAATQPGTFEYQIEAVLDFQFRSRGGTGAAYPSIVAGGHNATILHYTRNQDPLRDGDLLLIDAGCEYGYYAADVTRTFPINGKFTASQLAVYEIVLAAQEQALQSIGPGQGCRDYHHVANRVLTEGLVDLGLLTGTVTANLEQRHYQRFSIHGTGHWLGLDVHDPCPYYDETEQPIALEPGMVLTVEPGLYFDPEDLSIPPEFRGIGIRIEDDVLVTPTGHRVLSAALPKAVDELLDCVNGSDACLELPVGTME